MRKKVVLLVVVAVGLGQLALKAISASEYMKQLSLAYSSSKSSSNSVVMEKSWQKSLQQMEKRISKSEVAAVFSIVWNPYFRDMSEAGWKSLFTRLKKQGAVPHLKFVHSNFASQMNEFYPYLYSKDTKSKYYLRAVEKQDKLMAAMRGLYATGFRLSDQIKDTRSCEFMVDFVASEKMIELLDRKDQIGLIASRCDKEISSYFNKISSRIPPQAQAVFQKLKLTKVQARP